MKSEEKKKKVNEEKLEKISGGSFITTEDGSDICPSCGGTLNPGMEDGDPHWCDKCGWVDDDYNHPNS